MNHFDIPFHIIHNKRFKYSIEYRATSTFPYLKKQESKKKRIPIDNYFFDPLNRLLIITFHIIRNKDQNIQSNIVSHQP